MLFTSKEERLERIDLDGVMINAAERVKLLSILFDDKLKFYKHIDILWKNVAMLINILYRITGICNVQEKELIHNTVDKV